MLAETLLYFVKETMIPHSLTLRMRLMGTREAQRGRSCKIESEAVLGEERSWIWPLSHKSDLTGSYTTVAFYRVNKTDSKEMYIRALLLSDSSRTHDVGLTSGSLTCYAYMAVVRMFTPANL